MFESAWLGDQSAMWAEADWQDTEWYHANWADASWGAGEWDGEDSWSGGAYQALLAQVNQTQEHRWED
eukprot:8985513-Alexandrium_andersonii.AAC.1